MSKKRPTKKKTIKKKKSTAPPPMPNMDKFMADITRVLQDQEFESIDDANAYLQEMMLSGNPLPAMSSPSAIDQAQDIMYDAWEARTRAKRIKLAKQALSISEDCADAYVLLAQESAKTLAEAKEFYEKGVAAGERAIGEELFNDGVGHFWGIIETRPYMRARAGLADCLWQLGENAGAIAHYKEMLILNPGDNQGLRYVLLSWLIESGTANEIDSLLQAYEEDITAFWLYNWALFAFKEQRTKLAAIKLEEAFDRNPHVPPLLIGEQKVPRRLPAYMGFGDRNEAIHYVVDNLHLWQQNSEAISWVQELWAKRN